MGRKVNGANNLETELPNQYYVLKTDMVPDKLYPLDVHYSIKAIKPPPGAIVDSEESRTVYQGNVMMALSGPEPFKIYKDLVVFHSFLTHRPLSTAEPLYFQDSSTYLFAERTNKTRYDDTEIESIDPNVLARIGTNFEHFPIAINVGIKPVFRYLSYRNAFSVFLHLKNTAGTKKIQSQNKRLYDQIHLWEFARNFVSTHRVYSNDYMPVALCMTILESLIGRPKRCSYHAKCPECDNPLDHDAETWSKHFRKQYVRGISSKNIKLISTIRNEMYHQGNLFDMFEEFDKVMKKGEEKAGDKGLARLDYVEFIQDEIIQVSRRKLLNEFLRKCSAA